MTTAENTSHCQELYLTFAHHYQRTVTDSTQHYKNKQENCVQNDNVNCRLIAELLAPHIGFKYVNGLCHRVYCFLSCKV